MLVLEKDRIRALRAIDLGAPELAQAPAGLQQLSWTGFTRAATRAVTNEEFVEAGTAAAAGIDIGMRPKFWRPPDQTAQAWREAAKPLATLRALHPTKTALIDEAVSATGRDPAQVGYLAILARSSAYVALIDTKSGDIVGYAPVDGN
jgi:hypothetical protein